MAGSYNAGSVNAKVTLDDEEFKRKLKEAKEFTEQFANQAKRSSNQLQASMANTESTINNLVDSTKKLKEGQQQLYGTSANLSDSIKQEAENIKKLSQESKNAVKNVDEVAKANDRLSKSMEIRRKQAKLMTTDLDKTFTKDLHKAITEAEKLLNGDTQAVGLKSIYEELSKKYAFQFGGIDEFNKKLRIGLTAMGAYYKNIERLTDIAPMVDVGKGISFNFIDVEILSTIEQLEKDLNRVTEAEKENIKVTKQLIEVNKQLGNSQKEINPKRQQEFNKVLFEYLDAMANPLKGFQGSNTVTLKHLKDYAKVFEEISDLNTLISNAMHTFNAPIKGIEGKNILFDISNLKKPLSEVKDEVEKVTTAEKELETQAEKTATALQTQFNHFLYERLRPHSGKQFAEPFINQMRDLYSSLSESEFDKMMDTALKATSVKVKKLGSSIVYDLNTLTKPIGDLKKANEELMESARQKAEAIQKEAEQNEKLAKSTKTETTALKKETEEIKQNTLSYKENLAVRDAMLTQAYSFLSKSARLKQGNLNSIIGQDGARWVDKGILDEDFRVRMFDLERFRKNIREAFEGIIPTEQLKENLKELEKELELGHKFTGNFDGIFDYNYDYLKGQIQGINYSLEELIEKFSETETKENTLSKSTDKLTEKNNKNAESTQKMVEANKQLLASLKEVDLEAQLMANRKLYSMMKSYQHTLFDAPYDLVRLTTKDIHYSDEENEKLLNHALKEMNARVVDNGEELIVVADNLKKPILDIIDLENKLVENSGKIVNAKKHEAEEFKRYTQYELDMLRYWNSEMKNLVVEGTSLFPINFYKNDGDHKSERFRNYSSILNSIKRNNNWINRGRKRGNTDVMLGGEYYSDTTEFVQRRLAEMASDLGVTVSDVIDKEYKKVRSKVSGKMVEYLDVSDLTSERIEANEKWLNEAQNQLYEFKRFEKKIDSIMRDISSKILHEMGLDNLKKEMDRVSRYSYEEYGRKGNPYIQDYIQKNDLNKYYKEAQRVGNIQDYFELNLGRNPVYVTRKISDGMRSLDRVLRQTAIDWESLNSSMEGSTELVTTQIGQAVTQANKLNEAIKQLGTTETKTSTQTNELVAEIKKLGIATDEFGFVYLGDLLKNFEKLPVQIQNALRTLSRVMEKEWKGLNRKGSEQFLRDFNYVATKELFPLINTADPRYSPFNQILTPEQFNEQKQLFKDFEKFFGTWYPNAYNNIQRVIGETTQIGAFGGDFRRELEYSYEVLKTFEPRVRSTAQALDLLMSKGTKFMTLYQWNSPSSLNYLLSEGNGLDWFSKIRPLNKENWLFDGSDKRFLEKIFKEIYNPYRMANEDSFLPLDARHIFKFPSWKQLTTHDKINMPYSTEYLKSFEDTKEGYEQFVKYAQTRMINTLRLLNMELSKELSSSRERVRVWVEDLNKYQNMGSIDLSKMIKFGDFQTAMAYVEMMSKSMVDFKDEIAMAIAEGKEIKDIVSPIKDVGESIEKSAESANKLKEGLELIGKTSKGISKESLTFGGVIAGSINKATGEITPFTVKLKDASEKIKQVGASEEATTKSTVKLGNAIKNIIKLVETEGKTFYGGTAPIGDGRIRFIDETSTTDAKTQADLLTTMIGNAKTQAEGLKAIVSETATKSSESIGTLNKELEKLSAEYRKVSESGQYFGISMYQAYANIIPVAIKAREELLKLGEAQEFVVKLMGMKDISGKAKSPQRYLNLYTGQIANQRPYIEHLEAKAVNAFEKIKQKSSETKRVVVDDLEAGYQMSKRVFEDWKNGTAQLVVSTERLPVAIKKVSEEYNHASQSEEKFARQSKNTTSSVKKEWHNIFQQLNAIDEEIGKRLGKSIDSRNLKTWDVWGDGFARSGETIANTTNALKTFDTSVLETANNIKIKLMGAMRAFYEMATQMKMKIPDEAFDSWRHAIAEIESFERRYTTLQQRMYELSRGMGYWRNQGKVNTGYGKLLEDMGLLNTAGSKGRINVEGYSDYVARINEIKLALEGAHGNSERFKQSLVGLADAIKLNNDSLTGFVGKSEQVVRALTQMAEANERYTKTGSPNELNQLIQRLEHFSIISDKHKNDLKGLTEQAKILQNSFKVITEEFRKGTLSEEAYDKEINKLNADLKKLGSTATQEIRKLNLIEPTKIKQVNNELRKSKQSVNEFGTAMNNQEKYVDNLYRGLQRARSVIISMKTILRMMGGMAVWNFAFEMVESAKETYKAKNEMESLLNQNKKIDASGIQYFNKQLDETAEKFQKINKYSLGETATSIGLEFDLNAKEMGKSLDIIAMIQSEYVRAGRTVDEAGLAVKDILQGEFMRLSRETGVGKQELQEAGWSGDNKDVLSLMEALDKVGKERHWDEFAKKATSLNDVLTITQSRFSELGAEIGTVAEPLIVGAFNNILNAVKALKDGFEGLGSFGKNFAIVTGGTTGILGIAGAYLMLAKNMGALDIATIGLGKSLLASTLQLDKADVAYRGLTKTLIGAISGTNASTVANIGLKRAIAGKVLGLNQAIIAEQGFGKALTASLIKMREGKEAYESLMHAERTYNTLKKQGIDVERVSILTKDKSGIATKKLSDIELTRSQKLAMLTRNVDSATVKEWGRGKALLKTATSTKVLLGAFKALSIVGIATWFASVASWTDVVSKRMEKYNTLLQEGTTKIKQASRIYKNWSEKLEGMSKSDSKYSLTSQNAETAKANLNDLKMANTLAKRIKKESKEVAESNDLMLSGGLNNIYNENGLDVLKKGGQEYQQMKYVAYDIAHAEEERYKFEYASLQHITEHTAQMKKAGVDEEKRLKYITEYSTKAKEVAENLKKFNEGDLTAGMYYVLGKLELMWIDLWNDSHFVNFWESVKKTWKDLQPTINQLVKSLGDLGHLLLDFFSTQQGQIVGGAIAIGAVIAGIAYKVAPTIKKLKEFGGTLKDVLGKIKDWKRETGSDDSTTGDKDSTSTGGINGDVGGKGNGKFWGWDGQMAGVLKTRALSFVNNALLIAEGMALMTEAIYMIQAPMWALAETGKTFKAKETSIRAGIEGLQLIAPTFIAILVPIMALMKIMDMWGSQIMNIKTIGATAIGIALGMVLVTEAIIMLKAPMWALSEIGKDFSKNKMNMENAITAINTMAESLKSLASFIPAFLVGIALMAVAFAQPEVGALAIGATVIGIALGMVLLTEAIVTLRLPLEGIAQLGNSFTDIEGAKKGAEAIKVTAEAMKYISEAFGYLVTVQWDILKSNIAQLLGVDLGTTLDDLVKDNDGFLPKLSKFAEKFNSMEFTPIQEEEAQQLKTTAEGLNSINDALKSATDAINNLPSEFKNGGNGQPLLSYDMETGSTSVTGSATGEETSNYFDQLKQPLEELGKFIKWFNEELQFPTDGVDSDKIATISQSADMVSQINDAVNKVKETMGNIGLGNIATNFAQSTGDGSMGFIPLGGIGAMANIAGGFLGGSQGDYQSSIGGQLYEMEMVLKDLATFNSHVADIAGTGGGASGDGASEGTSGIAQGLTDMVTAVSTAISTLESTLAQAVPNIKTNATNIGSSIRDGIKTGMGDLTTLVVPPFVTAMQSMKANATTYGKGVGYNLREGVKAEAKVKEVVEAEINYTVEYLDGQKQVFYDKGAMLGEALSSGLKEKGLKQQSPGTMARTTLAEMYYMGEALDEGMEMLPQKAIELGNIISTSFNPQLAMGGLSVDDLSAFESGLNSITYMANDTNAQTSLAFTNMNMTTSTTMGNMTTTVNGAFNSIDQNATTSYGRIVNTTRTSLKNMQDQTTKNITAIRTSWKGMQNALIASAEQIRSETSSKIHQLESNMASFWNKIQNPANLLAGNPMLGGHTTPRHRPTGISTYSNGKRLLSAGNPALGQRVTGISDKFNSISSSDSKIREKFAEYIECLMNGGMCVAGGGSGWHFNWSKEIQDVFMQWHTHFGEIYDPYLRVGKFENDDFPVRGIAPIALKYIEDAISRTSYDFYYDERYSPLEAWNRGAFNCVDGANLAIAFANAFGFGGGELRYTTWDGIGHAYAYIPGLGVIDATAIQGHYGLTASKVSYSAGSHTIPQNKPSNNNAPNNGTTINIGDINVHIEGDVENAKEKGKQIGEEINNRIYDMLRRNLGTGQ